MKEHKEQIYKEHIYKFMKEWNKMFKKAINIIPKNELIY